MSGRFYPEPGRWVPPRRRRRRSWPFLLLLASIFGLTAGYYYTLQYHPLSAGAAQADEIQASSLFPIEAPSDTSLLEQLTAAFPGRRFLTLLVLGTDENPPPERADTLILALLDLQRKRLGVISIPRDTRVRLPGYGLQKINAAYTYGGAELARQVVGELMGCRVDYYLKTNVAGFVRLVDLVGGVQLEVEKPMHYQDRAQDLYIHLEPGVQWLNGERAMQYVRFRHDREGDLGRIRRQQKFMCTLGMHALHPGNLPRLPALLQHLPEAMETDLNLGQMKALLDLFRRVDFAEIPTLQLPGRPEMEDVFYLVVEPAVANRRMRALLQSLDDEPADLTVAVFSLPEHDGLRAEAQRRLQAAGFHVVEPEGELRIPAGEATAILDSGHHYFLRHRIRRLLGAGSLAEEAAPVRLPEGLDMVVVTGPDVPWSVET